MGYIQWPFMLRGSLMNDEQPSGTNRTPEQEAALQRHLRYQTRQRKGQPSPGAASSSFLKSKEAIGIRIALAGIVLILVGILFGHGFGPLGLIPVLIGVLIVIVGFAVQVARSLTLGMRKD